MNRTLTAGVTVVGAMVLLAVAAPLVTWHDPTALSLTDGLKAPSWSHPFGTDQLGRDVWARVVYAARTDLRVGVLAVITPLALGTLLGLVAGYFGGILDQIVRFVIDTVMAFPFYVIVLALVAALGAGEGSIYLALAVVAWVNYARVVRNVTRGFAGENWVAAARGGGLSRRRVIFRHILPNAVPQLIVLAVTDIVFVVLAIVTLSYLGLGIQPPTPDWGTMISDGQTFVTVQWWIAVFPGLAVLVAGIGFSLLADGLADAYREKE
ncbi:ABC transporter permease [Kineosporia sp. J2-2]|uniref:ABC transporter permease n=1 Tax=Kineosporia corallincola TaxID=2835133 RepID=A0ABS5TCC6_9ACTN|nr:ABC transporter permease [Kineosporia corallincola]MBT0768696.1 ABC transporter permease [Kineosporia corallincola]